MLPFSEERQPPGAGSALAELTSAWRATQALRAADSVHANLAEAMGRHGDRDQRHFLYIARGSALELADWLDTADRRGLDHPQNGPDRAREIARMLNGLIERRTRRMSHR